MIYYAFTHSGGVYPLGDCSDGMAASEIAEDTMPDDYVFVMSADEIVDLADAVLRQLEKAND